MQQRFMQQRFMQQHFMLWRQERLRAFTLEWGIVIAEPPLLPPEPVDYAAITRDIVTRF